MNLVAATNLLGLIGVALTPVLLTLVFFGGLLRYRKKRQAHASSINEIYQRAPRAVMLPILTLLILFPVLILRANWLQEELHAAADRTFAQQVDRLERDVRAQFDAVLTPLKGLRSTYQARNDLSREEFRRWVASHTLDEGLRGVSGYSMVEPLLRRNLPAFEALQRAKGAPNFKVRSASTAPDLMVVKYIEPLESNVAALGLDIGAEPRRRAAAERAMRTGLPGLTERIALVQDGKSRPGYLYFVPMYGSVAVPSQEPERLRLFRGWVNAPLILADLMAQCVVGSQGLTDFSLYEGAQLSSENKAFDSTADTDVSRPAAFSVVRTIPVGGQTFTLKAQSSALFENALDTALPFRKVFFESTSAVLLSLLIWMLMSARSRAQALAQDMTQVVMREKERTDHILSGTLLGTWENNRITGEWHINGQWAHMLGYTVEEVLPDANTLWRRSVHPDDLVRIDNALAFCLDGKRESYSLDVRARRKDGSEIWVLTRGKVMSHLPDGRVEWTGGVISDVTEVKKTELSLRDAELFLQTAGRIAGIGAWQVDLKTMSVKWNDQTREIHGLDYGYQPTLAEMLAFYSPADKLALQAAMARAQEMGVGWDMTLDFTTQDAQHRWVRLVGEVEFDDSGAVRLLGSIQDVTNQHESQLLVQRSEAIFREAIDTLNEAFVLFDPQDKLVFCNDQYRQLYGSAADVIVPGVSFESIIREVAGRGFYPKSEGRLDAWVQEKLEARRRNEVNEERKLGDGRWLRVLDRRMGDGHIVGLRVDITEIKERAIAAQAVSARLAVEQERLQSILEATHAGAWEWNVREDSYWLNERCAQLIGYTLEELGPVGMYKWAALSHPDDVEPAKLLLAAHFSRESSYFESESRFRHKDDRWIWVQTRGRVSQWSDEGEPLWMSGTYLDISNRKHAELELASTTATLQSVLDSAVDVGVIATGIDRTISVFNRGAENLLGYSAEEMVGTRTPSVLFELQQLEAVQESLALGLGRAPTAAEVFEDITKAQGQFEWNLVRKDGSSFVASMAISPMLDAQGARRGYLAVVYDITRQKAYEASLQAAMELAEQSNVAKSQFLANMSHEIRTPMNAILGMLKLLQNTQLNARQSDYSLKAENAARSLLGLLNDILDFSKVEAGKMELDVEPFSVDAIVQDLSVILSSSLGLKNVDLIFDLDSRLPCTLVGDALRLKQVLINLGGNAIKFTHEGAVTVRMRELSRHEERVQVQIAVQDTGIGIAPENQAKVFEAFTQAESNTTRRFGGTGLGLVISTRLVRLMGGELELQSKLGEGSTFGFTLELPYVPALGVSSQVPLVLQQTTSAGMQRLAGMRILLVEDNPINQQVAQELLSTEGAVVTLADNGQIGVELLTDTPAGFHVVLLDLQMPVMDGLTAARSIRGVLGLRELPLIAMTANAMVSDRSDCLEAGMNDHVGKPFDLDVLVRTLIRYTQWTHVAPSQAPKSLPISALDWPSGIDGAGALARMGGNKDIFQRSMRAFVQEAGTLSDRVDALLQQGDRQAARRELHSFKGLSGTVGVSALSELAAQAENCATGVEPMSVLSEVLQRLRAHIVATMPALQEVLERLQTLQETPEGSQTVGADDGDALQFASALRTLVPLLRMSDLTAMEVHAGLSRPGSGALDDMLSPLDAAMSDMDFELALLQCELILKKMEMD